LLKGKGLGFSVNAAIGSDVEQRIGQRNIDTEIEHRIGQRKSLNNQRLVNSFEDETTDIGFGDKSFWNNSFGENAFKGLEQGGIQAKAQPQFGQKNLYQQPKFESGYEQDFNQINRIGNDYGQV